MNALANEPVPPMPRGRRWRRSIIITSLLLLAAAALLVPWSMQRAHATIAMRAAPPGDHTLEVLTTRVEQPRTDLAFRIDDADGTTVTRFSPEQTKRMHLIVVRSNLTEYQHLHPKMSASGTWTTPARLREDARYRLVGDFLPTGGERSTAARTIEVGSPRADRPPDELGPTTVVVDGLTVTFDAQHLSTMPDSMLHVSVSDADGAQVDLEPYLGTTGHAVLLRRTDLEYLHVHPTGGVEADEGSSSEHAAHGESAEEQGAGKMDFAVVAPTAGLYGVFVQFRTESGLHTASTMLHAAGGDADHGAHSDADE